MTKYSRRKQGATKYSRRKQRGGASYVRATFPKYGPDPPVVGRDYYGDCPTGTVDTGHRTDCYRPECAAGFSMDYDTGRCVKNCSHFNAYDNGNECVENCRPGYTAQADGRTCAEPVVATLKATTFTAKDNLDRAFQNYNNSTKTHQHKAALMTAALTYLTAASDWAKTPPSSEQNEAMQAKQNSIFEVLRAENDTGLNAPPDAQRMLHKVRTNTAMLAAITALRAYNTSVNKAALRGNLLNTANVYLRVATAWAANPLSNEQAEANTTKVNAEGWLNDMQNRASTNIATEQAAVAASAAQAAQASAAVANQQASAARVAREASAAAATKVTASAAAATTKVTASAAATAKPPAAAGASGTESEYGFRVIEPSDYGGDNTVSFSGNGGHMSFRAASDKCASEPKCYGFVFVTNPVEAKDTTNLYNNPTAVKGHAHFKAYKSSQGRATCGPRPACGTTHRFFEKMVTPTKLDNNTIQTALGGDKGFKWPDLTCTSNCKSFPVSTATFYPIGCSSTFKNLSDVQKEAAYLAKPAYTAATGTAKTTEASKYMNTVVAYRAAASTWATWAAWTGSSERAAADKSKAEAINLVNQAANLTSLTAPAETTPMPPASGGGRKKTLRKKRNTGKKASKAKRRK